MTDIKEIKEVSIDMSTCDIDAGNRIFANVIEVQEDTLLCEFDHANYNYNNSTLIRALNDKIAYLNERYDKLKEESWIDVRKLGKEGRDYDLIPADQFLECVKEEGFIDEDGFGVEAMKLGDMIVYCSGKGIRPSEVYDENSLNCDYVIWWNK